MVKEPGINRILLAVFFFTFVLPSASLNAGQIDSDRWRVEVGTTAEITAHTVCKKVTNNDSLDIFVPVKTAVEWQAFINNHPATVVLAECCIASSSCAASTCAGLTCTDACGNVYAGTVSCPCACSGGACIPCVTCEAWGNQLEGSCSGDVIATFPNPGSHDACRDVCQWVPGTKCIYSNPHVTCYCYNGPEVADPQWTLTADCN